jgi:hypothetical protein
VTSLPQCYGRKIIANREFLAVDSQQWFSWDRFVRDAKQSSAGTNAVVTRRFESPARQV